MKPQFSKKSLEFIAKASRQKKPDWLDRNREEYNEVLVEPLRELMIHAARELKGKALGYRFPTRNFARIRRSADRAKAQGWYKNWVGISVARDSGSRYEDFPALYFHISGKEIFSAGGLYMASARQTKQIRAWIDQDPSALEALLKDREFRKYFKELGTERTLKTKPRDYPLEHPRIDWLKLTGWYVWRPISEKEFFSKNFAHTIVKHWEQILRLNAVLDRYTRSWPKKRGFEKVLDELDDIRAPKVDWESD